MITIRPTRRLYFDYVESGWHITTDHKQLWIWRLREEADNYSYELCDRPDADHQVERSKKFPSLDAALTFICNMPVPR